MDIHLVGTAIVDIHLAIVDIHLVGTAIGSIPLNGGRSARNYIVLVFPPV